MVTRDDEGTRDHAQDHSTQGMNDYAPIRLSVRISLERHGTWSDCFPWNIEPRWYGAGSILMPWQQVVGNGDECTVDRACQTQRSPEDPKRCPPGENSQGGHDNTKLQEQG